MEWLGVLVDKRKDRSMTTIQELPRKLLDVACRIRVNETLFRDDELVDDAAHALKAALDENAILRDAAMANEQDGVPFSDTGRAALLWVLWHYQGGSSPVGQPLRFALGMGEHDRLTESQLLEAKRWGALRGHQPGACRETPNVM
jgi:hypothetical protein